ncbi:LOW QUALITY PROTEIN: toxin CfTX-A-like [Ylistrum balloti]|uniref:LOW QUALITY PROTEIN: toxin CfTX-A-like n=1 Tax=Ylistrum balloti TaxID=509963 RepID=UPI002905E4E0|nr:LOW QUALITY PROTEIN: toxin CfTX-A-like [Ylistrum balloti]
MLCVGDLCDILTKIEEFLRRIKVNIRENVEIAKRYFQSNDGSIDAKKLEEVYSFLKNLYGYLPDFTCGDLSRLLQGVAGITSTISSLTGIGGPVVPVICGVLRKVFSAFGGKTITVGEIVEGEIRRTFSGHTHETLHQEAEDVHLIYRFAFDFLNQPNEKGHLSEHDITNMNVQMNVFQGATFLRKLGKLIKVLAKEHEEDDPGKKTEKVKNALEFVELYVKLASLRDMVLFQFYTITNSTAHSQHLAGGIQRVIGSFDEQDRDALGLFLKPTKEYAYIVSYVREEERELLMMFLDQKKLLPDQSWLTHCAFELHSVKWPEYHAVRLIIHRSLFGNGDLRFIRGSNKPIGPESWFCFKRIKRKGTYHNITPMLNSHEFVCMTKGSDHWVMSKKDAPEPESEWKVIQMDNGNYVFSPRAFPDYFMGMTQLLDGSVAGFLGCSRTRCQWTLKASQ